MNVEKTSVDVSLILPIYNEAECVAAVLDEACAALKDSRRSFEILAVDDGSEDETPRILRECAGRIADLRVFRLKPHSGQSAAIAAGVRRCRGRAVVLMDADGQNDPADIPRLIDGLKTHDICCGYRAERRDSKARIFGSKLANMIRNRALNEDIIDTGCTLKAFKAGVLSDFPPWRGMHRFLPALARMRGASVTQIPVNHRPRRAGRSKYTNRGRLWAAFCDLWAVRWMQSRNVCFEVEVVHERS